MENTKRKRQVRNILNSKNNTNFLAFNFGGRNIGSFTGQFGLFLSISWFWIESWVLFYWNESGREQGCPGFQTLIMTTQYKSYNKTSDLGIPGRKINTAVETILHTSNLFIVDIVNGG